MIRRMIEVYVIISDAMVPPDNIYMTIPIGADSGLFSISRTNHSGIYPYVIGLPGSPII